MDTLLKRVAVNICHENCKFVAVYRLYSVRERLSEMEPKKNLRDEAPHERERRLQLEKENKMFRRQWEDKSPFEEHRKAKMQVYEGSEHVPWRKPMSEREGAVKSRLGAFKISNPRSNYLLNVTKLRSMDISPRGFLRWLKRVKVESEIYDQRYVPERHNTLGNDLATAHFVVYRGGAVKFLGRKDWIKHNEEGKYDLPNRFDPSWILEAVDASNMVLYYEGLENNITELRMLKWLSVKGCSHMDDWCIDRITGEFCTTLEYLDISDCPKVTARGIGVLYKCDRLKTLKVYNIANSLEFQLACLMLQEHRPSLDIEGVKYIEVDMKDTDEGEEK